MNIWSLAVLALLLPGTAHAQYGPGPSLTADPCALGAKTSLPISQIANTKLIAQVGGKKIYLCSILVVAADAENISVVEGTGATCGTGTAAGIGGTTAATGPNLAASAGFVQGNGASFVAATAAVNTDLCLLQSGVGRVAGLLTYVQQ